MVTGLAVRFRIIGSILCFSGLRFLHILRAARLGLSGESLRKQAVARATACIYAESPPDGKGITACLPLAGRVYTRFTKRARTAFKTAITMTPTSAKIASHILAMPSAPRSRQINLTPMANQMFS